MRKLLFSIIFVWSLVVVGCGTDSNNNETENDQSIAKDKELNPDETEKEPLTLQLLKADEDAGMTLENNEIYQWIQAEIDADPFMGDEDDLSLYPFDIVESEDGSSSLMFLVINRLDNPIQNLIFSLTFGNDEGEYIFDDVVVDLPETYLGILDKNGVVPILVDMDAADEELFQSLTLDNVYLKLDNIGIDFDA